MDTSKLHIWVALSLVTSLPRNSSWPERTGNSRMAVLIKVVLPAPLGPTMETNSPSLI